MKRFLSLLLVLSPASAHADVTALDCSQQPNVSITSGSGSYKVSGTCDKVAISGGDNKVAIEATKNLAITGSSNQVTVDKADKIAAMGSKNTVTYGAGLTVAKPKIATTGKGNIIVQAAATPVDPVDTSIKTGATAPIPHDCTKAPTKSIATNDRSYVFTGKCTAISVAGNNNSLKVESTRGLGLDGNNNFVEVTAVDKLSTNGNDNTVRWKKGVAGAKAKVSNLGNGNKIAQTK